MSLSPGPVDHPCNNTSGIGPESVEAAVWETSVVSIVRLLKQLGALMIVGSFGWVLAACGSPTTASLPQPVKACSLMSKSEAASIFAVASSYRPQQQASNNKQSYCSYPGSTQGTYVLANVTWSPAELATFQKVHDGRTSTTEETLPSGESVPAPTFLKVIVDGDTAYWVAHQPLPVPGSTNHPSFMTATKNGYVVSLSAMGLTESQNEQILSTMLGRL